MISSVISHHYDTFNDAEVVSAVVHLKLKLKVVPN